MKQIKNYPSKVILFGEHTILYGGHAVAMAIDIPGSAIVLRQGTPGVYIEDIKGNSFILKFPEMKERVEIKLSSRLGCGLGSSAVISLILAEYYLSTLGDNSNHPENNEKIRYFIHEKKIESFTKEVDMDLKKLLKDIQTKLRGSDNECKDIKLIVDSERKADLLLNFACQIENLFHGRSSGIDVVTSWKGGVIKFHNSIYSEILPDNLKKYKLIIWDSGMGKDTKSVNKKVKITPEIVENIDSVVLRGIELIKRPFELCEIYELIKENHFWLEKLGVVPECMNQEVLRMRKLGIESKVSGAGNGGHLITFVEKDKFYEGWTDVSLFIKQ